MKRRKGRLDINDLFVLGAGASFSSSFKKNEFNRYEASSGKHSSDDKHPTIAPLDKDFCRRISFMPIGRPGWYAEAINRITSKGWKSHRRFYELGLEQAIVTQLGFYEFYENIHKRRAHIRYRNFDFLSDITMVVAYFLSRVSESRERSYKKLFSIIKKHRRNRVISFNYDLLLDKYFLKTSEPNEIYFKKINCTKKREGSDNPLLLKLHGSINWFITQESFKKIISLDNNSDSSHLSNIEIEYKKKFKGDLKMRRNFTPKFYPLIIPPTPSKPVSKIDVFRQLWEKAFEYLSTTNRLIIYGYSLPDIDNLASSLFCSFENKAIKEIVVIDPDPLIFKKWKYVLTRKKINSKARWSYFLDFFEFCNHEETHSSH